MECDILTFTAIDCALGISLNCFSSLYNPRQKLPVSWSTTSGSSDPQGPSIQSLNNNQRPLLPHVKLGKEICTYLRCNRRHSTQKIICQDNILRNILEFVLKFHGSFIKFMKWCKSTHKLLSLGVSCHLPAKGFFFVIE